MDLIGEIEFPTLTDKARLRAAFHYAREIGVYLKESSAYHVPVYRPRNATESQRQAMTVAFDHYHELLGDSPEALRYLADRALNHPETLPLGYVPGHPTPFIRLGQRLQRALGGSWREIAHSVGLLTRDGRERLWGRIFVAEQDQDTVSYYQARAIRESYARYLSVPDLRRSLFGLQTIGQSDPVVLVEGPFDALPLHSLGQGAVATLGDCLVDPLGFAKRLGKRAVAVAMDRDVAGEAAATRITEDLRAGDVPTFRFQPKYKDLGEWAARESPGAVVTALRAATAVYL